MKATIDAHEFRKALAALRPKNRRFKSIREPFVRVATAPASLVLTGTLASTSTVVADVLVRGSTRMPLEPVYRLLSTFSKGSRILMEVREGRVYIDRVSFPIPSDSEAEQ